MQTMTRRAAIIGALSTLSGCTAITSLNSAAAPLDTYDLRPAAGSKSGGRRSRTLLVARPQASAALATDRIMIKPDAVSITYLPDARWVDELPAVLQSLLIRSISETGRIAYVGRSDAGPIPDKALLVRIDAFEVNALGNGTFDVTVDLDLTMINDSTQRVVASRRFSKTVQVGSDQVTEIVGAFQTVLNDLLPAMSDWAIART
ncbi:ABC-type transport auxiliary lipoprotein family protein [uncultured Sulfitobacter sp.]|uniref:ABC-type transport auxiliary lipoprotein family protein n=1 Tax=uncultured Sulfitobacter sp. TaxID=191468 RepID=UPI0030DD813B|tara:strand:+ start:86416 stop:87027 length:612 start_codon:yes stop_codon:yes gene_type:complete